MKTARTFTTKKDRKKKGVAWHELCNTGHDLETAEVVAYAPLLYVLKYPNVIRNI